MPTYRVTWRPLPGTRRLLADIEADEVATELGGARLVLWRYVLIVDNPRRIAVLRLAMSEAAVESLCSGDGG